MPSSRVETGKPGRVAGLFCILGVWSIREPPQLCDGMFAPSSEPSFIGGNRQATFWRRGAVQRIGCNAPEAAAGRSPREWAVESNSSLSVHLRTAAPGLIVLLVGACGSADTSAPEPGIPLHEARVDLMIGVADGEGPDVFGRIGGLLELPDGRIVVADMLANEIRVFSGRASTCSPSDGKGTGPVSWPVRAAWRSDPKACCGSARPRTDGTAGSGC